ncbi:ATP-dependent endonuclease [Candidatus Omnitrophota bacterium]
MKLQKLIIKNFRGLKGDDNIIDFSKSNIIYLIGQNNVGKSTFLRAYEFFVNSSQKALREDFLNHSSETPIEIEGIFLKEENDDDDGDLAGTGGTAEPDWINKWVDADSLVRVKKTWTIEGRIYEKETFSPSDNNYVFNGFGGLHQKFQKYTPDPISINAMEDEKTLEEKINALMQKDFIKKVRGEYPDDFDSLVSGIMELQEKIAGTEAVEALNDELNENFQKVFADLLLKIEPKHEDNIKLEDSFKKSYSIHVSKEGVDRKDTFLQYGHGVIRQALFNFLAFLQKKSTSTRKEYIILFEEPELCLHPKIAFKLRQSLYDLAENSPYQVLCATHSPLMIDISKSHSSLVRIAKDSNEATHTYQIDDTLFQKDEETKKRVQMINRFNPHICESFYADIVLLVEGDTETIVYRHLLNQFFPNKEMFVLNTGSKNNMPFFQEILSVFKIKYYIVHDTDKRINSQGNVNSAWTLNARIQEGIDASNGLGKRYVHISNFEEAHDIDLSGKDKPLKAYEFVSDLTLDSDADCLRWLKDIFTTQIIIHDQDYIEDNVPND